MLRRRHPPQIDVRPARTAQGFEHLAPEAVAMLTWLKANQVEFVLVGPVAQAIRGGSAAPGPVAIVLAPYRRNFERLSRALTSVQAGLRPDGGAGDRDQPAPAKTTAQLLATGRRLTFSCGGHYLDVEGRPEETPGYQELLYEAARFELAAGLSVDVASPEDIEHYAYMRRTGAAPEMRVARGAQKQLEPRPG